MTDAASVMNKLDEYASELDELSKALAVTERKLEPLETFFDEFVDDFETGCWDRHVKDAEKLPAAEMRLRLARKAMPTEILSQLSAALAKRKRIEKRVRALGGLIDAQRSLLSAHKQEAEASGAGLRSAA